MLGTSPLAIGHLAETVSLRVCSIWLRPSLRAERSAGSQRRGERFRRLARSRKAAHDDPSKAMAGVMLRWRPQGSGIAMWMDIFGGVLTGAQYGGEVRGPNDFDRPQGTGMFSSDSTGLFVPLDEFYQRADGYVWSRRVPIGPKA